MAPTRPQLASFALSLLAHAVFVGLVAAVTWVIIEPPRLVPVALLPGGGGEDGGGKSGAPAEPAAAAAVEVVPQPRPKPPAVVKVPQARPPAKKADQPAAPAEAVASVPHVEATGEPGEGEGAGTGGGSGGGAGRGDGAGKGSGSGVAGDVDLRLYCVSCPEPPYPRLARARGWQGATDVELTVLADGRVDGATVSRSSGFDVLDRAALEVARQSRFSPPPRALEQPVRGRLAYRFELRER